MYYIAGVVIFYGKEDKVNEDFSTLRNNIEPNLTIDYSVMNDLLNKDVLNNIMEDHNMLTLNEYNNSSL